MLGLAAPLASAQSYPPELIRRDDENRDRRLPNGRSQTEALIKEDHKRNLQDLKRMRELIDEVEKDIEKTGGQVVSMDNLKKLEDLENAAKRIRGRMRRY